MFQTNPYGIQKVLRLLRRYTYHIGIVAVRHAGDKHLHLDNFSGFKHHPDRVILAQGVILLLTYLCILPGSGLCIYGYRQKSVTLLLAGTAVLCVGLVIYLILSLMFSQTMFFLTDYIDIEAMQSLKESVRIMKGKKGKFFYLQLSFIGIYLLGAIACGIGLLWVIPYMQVTMANFYRKITGEV